MSHIVYQKYNIKYQLSNKSYRAILFIKCILDILYTISDVKRIAIVNHNKSICYCEAIPDGINKLCINKKYFK